MKTNRTLCTFSALLLALFLSGTAYGQVHNTCTGNEAWIPVGGGLAGTAIASTEMNGDLYVAHHLPNANPPALSLQISRWNGAAWSQVTSFEIPEANRWEPIISDFQGIDGKLYLAGNFAAINGDANLRHLAAWDGTTWSSARGSLAISNVKAMTIHNGKLVAAAYITAQPDQGWKVIEWNGSDWSYLGGSASQLDNSGGIMALVSWNGALYAGGEMIRLGAIASSLVAKWDGSSWSGLGTMTRGGLTELVVYNNELYASGSRIIGSNGEGYPMLHWNGTEWVNDFPMPSVWFGAVEFAVHDNQLYMLSGSDSIPNETAPGYINIDRFDGTAWHDVSNTNGAINMMVSHNGTLYIGGSFTESCGTPLANFARLCDDANCGKITGTVFHDENGNCTQDQNERGLPRRIVEIAPGGHYAITDENGNYSRFVEAGTYTVGLQQYGYWNQICPAAPGTYSVTLSSSGSASGRNFGAQPTPGIQDLRVSVVTGRARQGRQLTYAITYENAGTVPMNGTVRFTHDPILTFDSAQVSQSRYSPNVAEWDFTGLEVDERRTIHVWTTVPVTIPMGTNICSDLEIDPSNVEAAHDDRDSICVPVTGGYDPNDIQVSPLGIEENGIITPDDSVLTYWVRFQNTGNDTAFKVVVVDSLSSHLDVSSIRLGAASHPFSFSIDKSNVLVWTFNDIMLPDSTANETNSHGFFKFSVKLKPALAPGTQIPNQVHIYFDYNAPVATNTVLSMIGASMGVDRPAAEMPALLLYPNPSRETLHLNGELRQGGRLSVRNLLGETVASYRHDGGSLVTIDVRHLPAGAYLLEAETSGGITVQRFSVVK